MAVALTLNDLRKRQAPDGSIDVVIETLVQSNPILEDVRWAEGNLPTGNQTTQRNGLPEVHLRQINRGVPGRKIQHQTGNRHLLPDGIPLRSGRGTRVPCAG